MSLFEENYVTFFEKNNVELKWKKTQTMGAGVKVKVKVAPIGVKLVMYFTPASHKTMKHEKMC